MKRKDKDLIIQIIAEQYWFTLPAYQITKRLAQPPFNIVLPVETLYQWEKEDYYLQKIHEITGLSNRKIGLAARKQLGSKLDNSDKTTDKNIEIGLYLDGSYRPGEKQEIKQDLNITFNEEDKDKPTTSPEEGKKEKDDPAENG